jgi:hypothetical protein
MIDVHRIILAFSALLFTAAILGVAWPHRHAKETIAGPNPQSLPHLLN